MTVMDDLDKLRADCPGCQVVVYADLQTSMVLCASSQDRLPQEQYDRLCADGATVFASRALASVADALGQTSDPGGEVIRYADNLLQVFLRESAASGEGLCLQCTTQADPSDVLSAARSTLEKLCGGQG
jgi:hypothetical protein